MIKSPPAGIVFVIIHWIEHIYLNKGTSIPAIASTCRDHRQERVQGMHESIETFTFSKAGSGYGPTKFCGRESGAETSP
jgi:hypothetical protein